MRYLLLFTGWFSGDGQQIKLPIAGQKKSFLAIFGHFRSFSVIFGHLCKTTLYAVYFVRVAVKILLTVTAWRYNVAAKLILCRCQVMQKTKQLRVHEIGEHLPEKLSQPRRIMIYWALIRTNIKRATFQRIIFRNIRTANLKVNTAIISREAKTAVVIPAAVETAIFRNHHNQLSKLEVKIF